MRILVVEDEKDMNAILVRRLVREGYSVDTCFNGEDALLYIESAEYDAIVLDVMMPKLDGFGVVAAMRRQSILTPVLFLTARDAIEDRVAGLDLGANDYLVKPFSFAELLARIRAMTRVAANNPTNIFTVGDLTVDCAKHTAVRANMPIALSAKEFALLEYLIRNRGIVLSREKIEAHIWGYDYEGASNVVDVYIRYLRKKIDEGHPRKLLHTIRGYGYVLKEES